MDILFLVLQQLPPNEVACTARLVCKEMSKRLTTPENRTVRLSQPIPPHAAAWRWGEGAVQQLPFRAKLGALSTAAASGCQTNLEVAVRLVQSSFFPSLRFDFYTRSYTEAFPDPGTAAARAGHAHLLPWLVAHRCPVNRSRTLKAVAQHCDLAALQQAWEVLGVEAGEVGCGAVCAAARSTTPDGADKLQWLVQAKGCQLMQLAAPAAAAESGQIACLQWLQLQGAECASTRVLLAALKGGSMEAVRWVWGARKGARLCREQHQEAAESAAGSGVEGVPKLRWLREQHGVQLGAAALLSAARHGRLEAVRYLVEECGVEVEAGPGRLANHMAVGGDLGVIAYLCLRGAGGSWKAYLSAAAKGDLPAVLWLAGEGGLRCEGSATAQEMVQLWPVSGAHGCCASRVEADCLAALRAAEGAGAVLDGPLVAAAARRGSLALVRWLVEERGCELPPGALAAAAEGGSAAVLQWLAARGCRHSARVGEEYVAPLRHGDLATLALLRQLGVPWDGKALGAAALVSCSLPVLQWLVGSGMGLDRGVVQDAARLAGDRALRQWLAALLAAEQRHEGRP